MLEEIVYLGRNNSIELALQSALPDALPVVIDHSTLTRCQVMVGATLIDSATAPALFDFSASAKLILKFGASALPVGRNLSTITIFDADNLLGITWSDLFITVK